MGTLTSGLKCGSRTMLSMYLGKMEEAVYYPPVYFDNRYEDEWITDKQSVEIIRDVDKSDENILPIKPEKIIVEDSNSGYDFFHSVSEDQNLECESAHGKTKIFGLLQKADDRQICVIADGAAIGAEMNRLYKQCQVKKNIHLYLPESFEWIILNSGLLKENVIHEILQAPEEYIESSEFFSWERYFTKLLIEQTEGTYLKYKKSRLNKVYLHEKNKDTILKSIKGIKFKNY